MKAAVYLRISQDREGQALGVARQEEDCRALAERRGWTVESVVSDNDLSATRSKRRLGWEQLLKDLDSGRYGGVIAYSSSRMYRRLADLGRFLDIVKARRIQVATVASGDIDVSTADGRMIANILASVDQAEAERLGERVRRERLQRVGDGGYGGGGKRPFGYNLVDSRSRAFVSAKRARRDGLTPSTGYARLVVNEAEAGHLRDAAHRVLAGATLYSVVADWNARNVLTPTGKQWSTGLLRQTLLKPFHAGLFPDGTAGKWTAILTEQEHRLLAAKLARNVFGKGKAPRPGARRYALTGVLYCCECEHRLVGSGGFYRCTKINGGCGKVSVKARDLEDVLDNRIQELREEGKARDSDRPKADAVNGGDEILAELSEIEQRRGEIADGLAEGKLTVNVASRAEKKLSARQAELENELGSTLKEATAPSYVDLLDDGGLHARWESGDLTDVELLGLHEMFAAYFAKVCISPRGKRNSALDLSRIKVVWRS